MRALEAEYAAITRFPPGDVFGAGTIIAWNKQLDGRVYSYAAINTGINAWYVTGRTARLQYQYDSLVQFIGDGTNVRIIDPDVGVELDELVIEEGDDGYPWRNRVKEARNAVAGQLAEEFTEAVRVGEVPVTAATDGWVQPPSARELLDEPPVHGHRIAGYPTQ